MSTYLDIQRLTGLSLSTISKYMNGGNVRPTTKTAIDLAVKQLDYQINDSARSLRSRQTKSIGIIIPELESVFHTTIMGHVTRILRENGYACLICTCDDNTKNEIEAVDFLLSKLVDGIIVIPSDETGNSLKKVINKKIPIVSIDRIPNNYKGDAVTIDNFYAGELAADYLYNKGHREIAMLAGPPNIYTMNKRKEGFCSYLDKKNCLDKELICEAEFSIGGGYTAAVNLMQKKSKPTAIFCPNYEITLGTVMAINKLNLKYPNNISILGFDNMFLSDVIQPRLSMITQPLEDIAKSATQIVLDKLKNPDKKNHRLLVELPVKLIEGNSVGNMLH